MEKYHKIAVRKATLACLQRDIMKGKGKKGEETVLATAPDTSWVLFGIDVYAALYRNLLHSTGSSAQCCVAAWMRGEFGRE